MSTTLNRGTLSWGARLLIGLVLILLGAAASVWGLAHSTRAAQLLGIAPAAPARLAGTPSRPVPQSVSEQASTNPASAAVTSDEGRRLDQLEERLKNVEAVSVRAEGSAGRADNLVVAFAARRAIDRGVALGYLERLLVERFGARHPQAVAMVVTGARRPVLLNELSAGYEALGPALRSGQSNAGWWTGFKQELGDLVRVRNAKVPSAAPSERYERAARLIESGDVDRALAETMRLPGAVNAQAWVNQARRYVAVHRALDEIESSALMPSPAQR